MNFVLHMHTPKEVAAIKFLHLFPHLNLTMLPNRTPYTSGWTCLCSFCYVVSMEVITLDSYKCDFISDELTDGRTINGEAERFL